MITLSAHVLVHFLALIWSEPDDLPPTENLNSSVWFLGRGLNYIILSVTAWTVLYFSKHYTFILVPVRGHVARACIHALKGILVRNCNTVFSCLCRSRWLKRSWYSRCAIWDHRCICNKGSVHIENGLWTHIFWSSFTSFCHALIDTKFLLDET